MAPVQPHWPQPSHPDIQQVIINEAEYTSKSLSKISLPPFAVYAKMSFPPCSITSEASYATVQMGPETHLNLNSDLLYVNHSCDPSLIFDTGNLNILVGHKGIEPGDELTFFYPSTEWDMAQPFQCLCQSPQCRGLISGAKHMNPAQLEGYWLNQHIRDGIESAARSPGNGRATTTAGSTGPRPQDVGASEDLDDDATAQLLKDALSQAQHVVGAAGKALRLYLDGKKKGFPVGYPAVTSDEATANGPGRRGPTSRALSGEMGGDTIVA